MGISDKALLVSIKISQWTGRKLDRAATRDVEDNFKTEGRVGNYTKKLLPKSSELKAIAQHVSAMRAYFYENTLPWYSDGSRIISSKNYIDFTKEFGKRKREFDAAVVSFLRNYDRLQRNAEANLGNLYNASDYPSAEALGLCFGCEIAFFPVPDVSDFRTEVLDSEKANFIKAMRETEAAATAECYNRLKKVISKATETLAQPKAIFRDSLIDNITELCELLPKLNVMEDSTLESVRQEVARVVRSTSSEGLRRSADDRKKATDALSGIMDKMAGVMGGAQ